MPWTEVRPGLFRRPLGENERFIKLIGDRAHEIGREHWSVTSHATFQLTQSLGHAALAGKCAEAWSNLRYEHPTVATVCSGADMEYEIPQEHTLKAWIDETFKVHSEHTSFDDLLADLRPTKYVTGHLLYNNSIVLHFPHWRTDGYGALQLVHAFLRQLSSVISNPAAAHRRCWGEEACRLLPSVEEALDLPLEATPRIQDLAGKYLATAALLHTTAGLGVSEGTEGVVLPQGTCRVNYAFPIERTQRILETCRAKSVTIEAAVQASCGMVTHLEAPIEGKSKPYTSTMRFTLRPYVQSRYPDDSYAAAICTGGFLVQVPASSSWLDNAQQYTELYTIGVTADFIQTRRQYAVQCLQALSQKPPPRPPVSSEMDISSVGDATELVSTRYLNAAGEAILEVHDVGIGVETLTRQVYCFMWIYRDRLHLCLAYNEAFYRRPRMESMLHSLKRTLVENLGL